MKRAELLDDVVIDVKYTGNQTSRMVLTVLIDRLSDCMDGYSRAEIEANLARFIMLKPGGGKPYRGSIDSIKPHTKLFLRKVMIENKYSSLLYTIRKRAEECKRYSSKNYAKRANDNLRRYENGFIKLKERQGLSTLYSRSA